MQFHENKCLNHYFLKRAVQPKLQEKMAWSAGIGCPAQVSLNFGAFQLVWGYPAQRNTADLKKNYLVQQSSGMHSLHALGCPAPSQSLQWIRGCPAQTWWHTKLLLFLRLFLQVLWVTSGNHHCQVVLYHGFSAIYCTRLPAFTASYCRLRSAPAAHTLGHASTSWTNPPLSPSHGRQCSLALGADGRQGYPATSKKNNWKHTKKKKQSRNPSQALMQPAQPTSLSGLLLFT